MFHAHFKTFANFSFPIYYIEFIHLQLRNF